VYLTCSKKLTGSQLSPPHGGLSWLETLIYLRLRQIVTNTILIDYIRVSIARPF